MGQDYEHYSLQLDMAHIAFQRWTQSVKLAEDATVDNVANLPMASAHETQIVVKLLGAIKTAFLGVESTSKRYDREPAELISQSGSLEARVQAAIRARQGGVKVLDKARWLIRDKKELEELVRWVVQGSPYH